MTCTEFAQYSSEMTIILFTLFVIGLGATASSLLTSCVSSRCLNGGTCVLLDVGFRCHCAHGYMDDVCATSTGANCGMNFFNVRHGHIVSPNFPNNYYNNHNCHYFISIPGALSIKLTFNTYDLESRFDYVEVGIGPVLESNSIAKFKTSYDPVPSPLEVASDFIWLRFHTDGSVAHHGFNITFFAESNCGSNFNDVRASDIISPNYPDVYENNLRCLYLIHISDADSIIFILRHLDLGNRQDYVEVGAGSVINNNSVMNYTTSNDGIPPYVEVESDTAWVLFHTDGFKVGQGFNITFTADLQSPSIPVVTIDRDPVIEGDDVTLTCSSSGIPPPVYTWYHNGEALNNHGKIHRIHGIDSADSGIYSCHVTNRKDTRATSIHFNVLNLQSPSIPVVTKDRDPVIEGDDVTLTCSSSGIPPPVYTWYHNGEALDSHGRIHKIHGINAADSGMYICHVTNREDTRSSSIYIDVLTPPSKIKNTTVSSVTDSLITVSWIPGYDGGSQQVFSIEYRKTSLHYSNGTEGDIHRTVNWSRTTTTNLTTHTLAGLQPSTRYILHVVSSNVVGETKSDSIQVTTAGEPTKAISAIKLMILIFLSVVACAAVSLIIAIFWNATRRRRQPSDIQAVSNKGNTGDDSPTYINVQSLPKGHEYCELVFPMQEFDKKGSQDLTEEVPEDLIGEVMSHLSFKDIIFGEVIRKGSFTHLMKAEIEFKDGRRYKVSVKLLRDTEDFKVDEREEKCLLDEARYMGTLPKHDNVVTMLGALTEESPVCLVFEFCPYGNLKGHLLAVKGWFERGSHSGLQKEAMYQQLRQYCMDVALGMAFLEEMKCVHRQLSARNVYVANGKKCKISELGASSAVLEDEEYEVRTKGRLPIRWMALESIQDCVYNTKTDVWSFGIVLWEIFNFGDEPYPEMTVKDVIYELQQGYRMPSSDYCSRDMYSLMEQCWQEDQLNRPSFIEITEILENNICGKEVRAGTSNSKSSNRDGSHPTETVSAL